MRHESSPNESITSDSMLRLGFVTESDALSALEKQRQKTRYSNDDLFKPRPVLSSGSRSRRRGYNCNE